jgi:tetratricopeptide (TPR) repeat protein
MQSRTAQRIRTAARLFAVSAIGLSALPLAVLLLGSGRAAAQGNLVSQINNDKMSAFEDRLTRQINTELGRYVAKNQYVLTVKVVYNQEVVPVVQDPALSPDKQKLPGFPIFVRAPDSPAVEDSTPPYTRLNVKVLLDETLPEYYERFARKLIPIVARFDAARGDQVIVTKETFPYLKPDQLPPTLPEKELMNQLGEQPALPAAAVPPPGMAPAPTMSPRDVAQTAFDEGRYQDALRAAQLGFQKAATHQERSQYLGIEGSVLYTMNNRDAARASWQRAATFDPANLDVMKMLNHLDQQRGQP